MAITIPETEPLDFYSGETVKWKRTDLSDYPAPTWVSVVNDVREVSIDNALGGNLAFLTNPKVVGKMRQVV